MFLFFSMRVIMGLAGELLCAFVPAEPTSQLSPLSRVSLRKIASAEGLLVMFAVQTNRTLLSGGG